MWRGSAPTKAFLWDVLTCPCGGRRELIAAVQEKAQVERLLRHLGLWPDADDIVAIRGPPDDLDYPDDDPGAECDGTDDPEPLSWAA